LVKRGFDVTASGLLAIVAAPLILVLAIAVAITFRAWPFFTQTRVGKDGRTFRFIKLRTLPPHVPAYADKYSIRYVKVPKLAQILRITHLDEIPQIFLVLTGRMSLVGPRPEMEILHDQGDEHFARLRTNVRPGCAGLWQVGEHRSGLIWEAPEYDVLYLRNQSFGLDLWILMRTALYMLHLRPAVRFSDIPQRLVSWPDENARSRAADAVGRRSVDLRDFDAPTTAKPRPAVTAL
jgi:lipopolysaccharide/colanic/teichoic acid biosynthesis glycosyltransferase